jgi:hypothetical protein
MTVLAVDQLPQPSDGCVVDSLRNVETEVESAVIASAEDQHELSRFMLCLSDLEVGIFFDKIIRVEKRSLVSQVLTASAEMLREVGLSLSLKDVGLVQRDTVPKLRLSLVEEVDCRQVQVLLVPAEKSLP